MRLATENAEVQRLLKRGYRLVETDNETATLVRPVERHTLGNVVMTVLTLGLWLIPWLIGSTFARGEVMVVDLTAPEGVEARPAGSSLVRGHSEATIEAFVPAVAKHLALAEGKTGLRANHHRKAAARLQRSIDRNTRRLAP